MIMAIYWLNGDWVPPEQARVPVLDRGFMFGDGVYELLPVYQGKPFSVDEHLARLARSLSEVKITCPLNDDEWRALILAGIEKCGAAFATVYLQVTRGIAAQRAHEFPESQPTVLLMVTEAPRLERREVTPVAMITLEDFRWGKGHIKSTSLLASGLLRNEAMTRGADDAILIRDGRVTEATASNVFIVKDGIIATPPKSSYLLHGITRDHVIHLARKAGMTVEERDVPRHELESADEIWISSTSHEAWPVGELDGRTVGNGEGGVVWREIDKLFQQMKAEFVKD